MRTTFMAYHLIQSGFSENVDPFLVLSGQPTSSVEILRKKIWLDKHIGHHVGFSQSRVHRYPQYLVIHRIQSFLHDKCFLLAHFALVW